MTEQNQPPVNEQPDESFEEFVDNFIEDPEAENAASAQNGAPATTTTAPQSPPPQSLPPQSPPQNVSNPAPAPAVTNNNLAADAPAADEDRMGQRLERLGGEPAPVITPEEFARLQKAGQVHIDERGRVRTARPASDANVGVSLRKRRAWYG